MFWDGMKNNLKVNIFGSTELMLTRYCMSEEYAWTKTGVGNVRKPHSLGSKSIPKRGGFNRWGFSYCYGCCTNWSCWLCRFVINYAAVWRCMTPSLLNVRYCRLLCERGQVGVFSWLQHDWFYSPFLWHLRQYHGANLNVAQLPHWIAFLIEI